MRFSQFPFSGLSCSFFVEVLFFTPQHEYVHEALFLSPVLSLHRYVETRLTADGAISFIGSVAASIPSAAGDRIGTAPSIPASERTRSRRKTSTIPGSARSTRLVASISARNYRVAELIRRQTLTVVASKSSLRAF